MWQGPRLRAGIAFDEFFAEPENEIFLGKAILEAYELEQAQEWSGAALTEGATNRIPKPTTTGERFQWWICDYAVPMKPTASIKQSKLAIDWTQGTHDYCDFPWSKEATDPSEDGDILKKWENTRKFHREICIACFPKNKGRDPLKAM